MPLMTSARKRLPNRLPDGQVTPADLDEGKPARIPASPIGAALDLLRSLEHAPE
jgi:hypothetical protein